MHLSDKISFKDDYFEHGHIYSAGICLFFYDNIDHDVTKVCEVPIMKESLVLFVRNWQTV